MSILPPETQPLLESRLSISIASASTSSQRDEPTHRHGSVAPWRSIVGPLLLITFLDAVAVNITDVTMSELGEGILCRNHFPDASSITLDDPRCKGLEVQAELSILQAVERTFGFIPSILTSVLYGMASDRYGCKPIMCLSILGILVLYAVDFLIYRFPEVLDIYLIWPAALLVFIGGGPPVMMSMALAMVSNAVSEAQRANVFLYLVAVKLMGNVVGASFTFYLMKNGPWFATVVGYSCLFAKLLVAIFLCHEHHPAKSAATDDTQGTRSIRAAFTYLLNPASAVKQTFSACVEVLWLHKKIGILLVTLLFSDLGAYSNMLFNQYIAKRFDWSWSQANLLASVQTISRLVLMIAVMPLISYFLNKTGLPPIIKDAQIARYAMLLAAASTFGIAFAGTFFAILPFLTLSAFQSVSRAGLNSLLPSLAAPERTGTLYSAMAVLDSLGMMCSAPAVALVFQVGLRWGSVWIGLPYVLAGTLMCISTIILFAVRITPQDHFSYAQISGQGERN